MLQCAVLKARKVDVNGYKANAKVRTTKQYNVMYRLNTGYQKVECLKPGYG